MMRKKGMMKIADDEQEDQRREDEHERENGAYTLLLTVLVEKSF